MTISPLVKSSKPISAKSDVANNGAATKITVAAKKRNPTIEDFNFRDGLPTAEVLSP